MGNARMTRGLMKRDVASSIYSKSAPHNEKSFGKEKLMGHDHRYLLRGAILRSFLANQESSGSRIEQALEHL